MKLFNSYVICTSPRSGSTLLCMLLREAGNAGFPESHFHAPSLEKWLGYYGFQNDAFSTRQDALKGVFKSAFERGKGASDIFGLRLQRHSFDFFIEQLSVLYPSFPDDKSRMGAAFGNTLFVHLTRENKLDQAISYVKAEQTGLWHMAPDGTELERLSEPKEPVYDTVAIAAQLTLSEQMDTEWVKWFVAEKIKPLRITYEELSAAPYATLGHVLEALGLDCEARDKVTPPVAKLADATNQEWAERFRLETQF
ncbi:MAG: sulfotransferase [Rhodobacteraceae bacterium]|nr:sulfotransferase [Paracoccaceae bacterium]